MLWSSDANGRLSWLNPAAVPCFGRGLVPGTGLTPAVWSDGIHVEDRSRCEAVFQKARAAREAFRVTCRRVDPQGTAHWVQDEATPRLSVQGRLLGFCGIALDISDVKQAEQDLRSVNESLRRSNKDLDEVARAASHDLKEPLSIVSVYSELLKRRYGDRLDEEAARFVKLTLDAVQRMHTLLNDLVSFLQVARPLDTPTQPVDASSVLGSALFHLRPAIEAAGATVTRDPMPIVMAQEGHLEQLFVALIDNALKFRADAPPRVHVGCARNDGEAEFSVSDNGIGIDPRFRNQVFGVFRRLHGYEYPGTGIGLAICLKIVERYGGRIWVDSAPGRGSTFRFTLPLAGRHEVPFIEPGRSAARRTGSLLSTSRENGTSAEEEPDDQGDSPKSRDSNG
jgi:PAS domain S-box-containing protein